MRNIADPDPAKRLQIRIRETFCLLLLYLPIIDSLDGHLLFGLVLLAGSGTPLFQHEPDVGRDLDGREQEHGPDQLQVPAGGLRWYRALQLPRHDPTLDVSHRSGLSDDCKNQTMYGTVGTVCRFVVFSLFSSHCGLHRHYYTVMILHGT
jgi:hypothetical protein